VNPGDAAKLGINDGDQLFQSPFIPAIPRSQQSTDIPWFVSRHDGWIIAAKIFSYGDDSFYDHFPVLRKNAA
jgi:hypothetical protein